MLILKRAATIAAFAAASLSAVAAPVNNGCDDACAKNVEAVFNGPSRYEMKIDDAPHAHITVTWHAKHRHDLKPVTFTAVAPVKLYHTTINSFQATDACHVMLTLVEQTGEDGDFTAYQVSAKNVACRS
jgi:hypothetical protein